MRNYEQLWQETLRKYGDDPQKLLEVAKTALEEYPNDKTFLYRAAVDEERLADTAEQSQEKRAYLHSAMCRMKKLVKEYPEDDDIKVSLVHIYSKLDMDEEAVILAYQCKNRELALRFCLKGEALRRHKQKIIDRKLLSLLSELTEGDMAMLDAAEGIIRAAIPDGNFQHYYESLAHIYMKRFDFYRAQGDMDAAYTTLRQVLQMAKEADAVPQRMFTAPLFDLLTNINPDDLPDRAWRWLLAYIESEIPQWKDDAALAEIVNDAYAYLKEKKIL